MVLLLWTPLYVLERILFCDNNKTYPLIQHLCVKQIPGIPKQT